MPDRPARSTSGGDARCGSIARRSQPELSPDALKALDDVHHVLLEPDPDLLGALLQLVAGDLPGEALVLHLLPHGGGVHLVERAVGTDVGDRDDEAGHLVAGIDGPSQECRPGDAGVVAMPSHRLDEVVRIATPPQLLEAGHRVRLRVALVVEVVEEAGRPPGAHLGLADAKAVGAVPADRGLDRAAVLTETVALRPFAEQGPGVVAGRHRHRR